MAHCLRPQGAHGALLTPPEGRERVVLEVVHGIQVRHAIDVVVADTLQIQPQFLGRERPGRVGVRVVALPHDVVHVQEIAAGHAEAVVDEARQHVLVEDLTGQLVPEVLAGPGVVLLVLVVDALQEVGNPTDPAFGEGDPHVREAPEHGGPDQVGRGLHDVDRRQRDQAIDGGIRRRDDHLRRRADVHAGHDSLVAACLPEGVPVVRVHAGPAQLRGIFGEGHCMSTLGCRASNLGRQHFGIPDGRQGEGNEAARV